MVSMRDWTKLSQMNDNKREEPQGLVNKLYKQRAAEAVKQAEEYGYFLHPTTEVLCSHCGEQNQQKTNIEEYQLISLMGIHLKDLGDIKSCTKLKICLLGNNFLSKIDALIECRHLIKLDVHSNQLTSIPNSSFWSSLCRLKVLHLHDNPLGKFETLQILASSPCLSILTLYDTPLSLKKNYRHRVVNSIWTLKALDWFVISDEEIIEDAVFSGRFAALSPHFRIDLCPHSHSAMSTFELELSVFQSVMTSVNSILARHSPVLIVQRYARGYLLRKRMGFAPKVTARKSEEILVTKNQVQMTLADDYEMNIRSRKSGTAALEQAFLLGQDQTSKTEVQATKPHKSQEYLHISMTKLQSGTLSILHADTVAMETLMAEREGQRLTFFESEKEKKKTSKMERENEKAKPKRAKSTKHFTSEKSNDDKGDATQLTDFRLKGNKSQLLIADATTEMILNKREAGQIVREAEREIIQREARLHVVKAPVFNFTTNKQRLFNRVQGTMKLSCLIAVQKAYMEREKAEQEVAKVENILGLREERQQTKERMNMHWTRQRAEVLKSRELDRAHYTERKEKQEIQQLNFLDKQQEYKVHSSDVKKVIRADRSFMQEFNSQHTSVSNALLRHDRQVSAEDIRNLQHRKVTSTKLSARKQQQMVKKYLEHRKMMRQMETTTTKVALNTKLLTEASERMTEAHNRVAHQKAYQTIVQTFHPHPPYTMLTANVPPP